jgi:hypothetical protein
MIRYHIFQGTAQQDPAPPEPTHRPAPWSLEEWQRLTDLIFRRVHPAQILPQFPGRTPDAVHHQYDRTWPRLCNRPWEVLEIRAIIFLARAGSLNLLPHVLTARSDKAIGDQMNWLRLQGHL